MSITLQNVSKSFGHFQALRGVSLAAASGELLALLGPSGCGKTTLLRIIAGLESADEGTILFDGEDATPLGVRERQVGFVFQHYALFRHMTVADNIAFGLRMRPRAVRPDEAMVQQRVQELLALVQLDGLSGRFPAQLSGGQRQRVALARALAVKPRVLLLDEPFGALEREEKGSKELRSWLRRLHDELHVTSLFVTHDQQEALEVADRVVLMNQGRVAQVGTPQEVWDGPDSPFAYDFLGDVNRFEGRVNQGQMLVGTTPDRLQLVSPEFSGKHDAPAIMYVRPQDFEVSRHPFDDGQIDSVVEGGLLARLSRMISVGPITRLELKPLEACGIGDGEMIEVHVPTVQMVELSCAEGEVLRLRAKKGRVFLASEA
jgi:sulfate/thiosulfate transport system ATP-binding protein